MKLMERIRTARRRADLSQDALAKRCGVARSAVANWESVIGVTPTVSHLIDSAEATSVAFEWLATGRGPMRLCHDPAFEIQAVDAEMIDDAYERRLISAYRASSARMQAALLELAEEAAYLRTGKRGKGTR